MRVSSLPLAAYGNTSAHQLPGTLTQANCTADRVGSRRPVLPPYHCDYFGANTTFDFFLQTTSAGRLAVTAFMHTALTNATMGVQLGAAAEVIVKCPQTPTTPPDAPHWSPCNVALFPVAGPGVDVVRLRSIGWEPTFRTYSIANISFTMAST
jgi:hypothetical protein